MPRRLTQYWKTCEICLADFTRKRFGARLEDLTRFKLRKTCSQSCGNSRKNPSHKTTYHLRARALLKDFCEKCKTSSNLEAHHIDKNYKNNTEWNIQTLCHSCHMKLHWRQGDFTRSKRSQKEVDQTESSNSETL